MFTADPIVAWRKWWVDIDTGLLISLFKDTVWVPGEKMTATCLAQTGPVHITRRACSSSPQFECQCGIWGVPARDDLPRYGEGPGPRAPEHQSHLIVVGRVTLWGRVIEHDRGWRAQYAYPYELLVQPGTSDEWKVDEAQRVARATAAKLRASYLVDVIAD